MQSCHIVVAVRLKTRMTRLRKTKISDRGEVASVDGAHSYNQNERFVCTVFHICGKREASWDLRLLAQTSGQRETKDCRA